MGSGGDTRGSIRTGYQRRVAAGDVIFDEGDPGDRLFVIQSGEIELAREGPGGHRVVARLGAGDFFGELALLTDSPRNADVMASGFCDLLVLYKQDFEAFMAQNSQVREVIQRVAQERLQKKN